MVEQKQSTTTNVSQLTASFDQLNVAELTPE